MSMLAKNPSDRPTAAQIASGTTVQPVVTGELVVSPSRGWSRRRLVGAVAALGIVVATSAGVVLSNRDERLPETNYLTPPTTPRTTPVTPPPSSKPTPTRPPSTTTSDDQRVSTSSKPVAEPPKRQPTKTLGESKPDKPGKPAVPGNGKSKGKNPAKKS
jgi:serine/threonine-protein kinase